MLRTDIPPFSVLMSSSPFICLISDLTKTQFLSGIEGLAVQSRSVLLEIIRDLFDGTVHYNNAGKRDLINNGVLTDCIELQRYLMALSSTLDIEQWFKQQTKSKDRVRYGPISKAIVHRLRQELHQITRCQPSDHAVPATELRSASHNTELRTRQMNAANEFNQQLSQRANSSNSLSGLRNAFADKPDDDTNEQSMTPPLQPSNGRVSGIPFPDCTLQTANVRDIIPPVLSLQNQWQVSNQVSAPQTILPELIIPIAGITDNVSNLINNGYGGVRGQISTVSGKLSLDTFTLITSSGTDSVTSLFICSASRINPVSVNPLNLIYPLNSINPLNTTNSGTIYVIWPVIKE